MGWWKSDHGSIGDGPADIMENAFGRIRKSYQESYSRLPTQGEIADLIHFCSGQRLNVDCETVKALFSLLSEVRNNERN